jgi:hypothetical protein
MLGERWYRVYLHNRPVGHFRSRVSQARSGAYEFATELVFKLQDSPEVRVDEKQVFATTPPFALIEASHRSGDNQVTISTRDDGGLLAEVTGIGRNTHASIEGVYTLQDYLAVEAWLRTDKPEVGARFAARKIDFDRLQLVTDKWQVSGSTDQGYAVRREAMLDDTEIQLDQNLTPVRFTIAELFVMERVANGELAELWRDESRLFHSVRYEVPIDEPLVDPNNLTRLVLGVSSSHPSSLEAWPSLIVDDKRQFTLISDSDTRRRVQASGIDTWRRETLTYPAREPRVIALAKRATRGSRTPIDQVHALTYFVHDYLNYREDQDLNTVHDTISARRGDCDDFADLFTTLARSVGLPARTVIGLAYSREQKSFALHAWNEVAIEGWWHGVDPTWGQTQLDATHLALPPDRELALLGILPTLEFELVEAVYQPLTSTRY